MKERKTYAIAVFALLACASSATAGHDALQKRLHTLPYKIAYECYVNGNWEIFVMNADGTKQVNITKTPEVHEHYPQISPDGRKVAFSVDSGDGRNTIRSLWVMDINGRNRKKVADYAREPFWGPDSNTLCYLEQEYPRWSVTDYYTKGIQFYDLRTGMTRAHPNSANLHHLYNPGFSPNGKWIVATVHAGMGYEHAILAVEANGNRIINLKLPGCRPCACQDGKHIAWGPSDHDLAVAPIDFDSDNPVVGPWSLKITDPVNKIYHIGWSPDGKYVAFSRGPDGEGDVSKKLSFTAANEMIGVYAAGWNIFVVPTDHKSEIDLTKAPSSECAQLTTNGDSNKQPVWFRASRR